MKLTGYAEDERGFNTIPTYHIKDEWYVTEQGEVLYLNPNGFGMMDTPYTVLSQADFEECDPVEVMDRIIRFDDIKVIAENKKVYRIDTIEHRITIDGNCQRLSVFDNTDITNMVHIVYNNEVMLTMGSDVDFIDTINDCDFVDRTNDNMLEYIKSALFQAYALAYDLPFNENMIVFEKFDELDPFSDFIMVPKDPTDKNIAEYFGTTRENLNRLKNGKQGESGIRRYKAYFDYFIRHCGNFLNG